jgi:hypothetical protein
VNCNGSVFNGGVFGSTKTPVNYAEPAAGAVEPAAKARVGT